MSVSFINLLFLDFEIFHIGELSAIECADKCYAKNHYIIGVDELAMILENRD